MAVRSEKNISIQLPRSDDLFIASDSEPSINVSGEAGQDFKCKLAIACQERIDNAVDLKDINV